MDEVKQRLYETRIKRLKEQLEIAIRQRNGFAENYLALTKTPYQERREIFEDCDAEIERVTEC